MNKIKNIFSFLIVIYFFLSVLQMTPYNAVNLFFNNKIENKKLTEFNEWRKLEKNKEEYKYLLNLDIEKEKLSFKKQEEQRTKDNKFTLEEVKDFASKIDFYDWLNSFRNQLLEFNFLAIFIFILFIAWKKWTGKV